MNIKLKVRVHTRKRLLITWARGQGSVGVIRLRHPKLRMDNHITESRIWDVDLMLIVSSCAPVIEALPITQPRERNYMLTKLRSSCRGMINNSNIDSNSNAIISTVTNNSNIDSNSNAIISTV